MPIRITGSGILCTRKIDTPIILPVRLSVTVILAFIKESGLAIKRFPDLLISPLSIDNKSLSNGTLSAKTASGLRSEEHTSELQSLAYLVCRLLLEKKKQRLQTSCVYECKRYC